MNYNRNNTRKIYIGNVAIGENEPIAIQSMTNTKTENVTATVKQILRVEDAGCDIIRVAVPNVEAGNAIKKIKEQINIPIVADIHFDHRLALLSIENGADKIRINPGNIGSKTKVKEVVSAAKYNGVPIRIGVNAGSLEKEILEKYNHKLCAEALVESANKHIQILEEQNFENIIVSLKTSDVRLTIDAYEKFSQHYDYPLHLGITEAGTLINSAIKSSAGIGYLLLNGIGDTIRISITGDPVDEIKVSKELLSSIGLLSENHKMIKFISCPTCGRTEIDLIGITEKVQKRLEGIKKNITVAIMGCVVNGPGEAKEADIGIAGGKEKVVIFKKGIVIKTIPESEAVDELVKEIMTL
jgi:(E)-4-hydroxy-3-methylbut-2-enyl-diphosphate synthase